MTHRERILGRIAGDSVDRHPYFPDLSYYHKVRNSQGNMPEKYAGMTLLEMHAEMDAGILVHVYGDYYKLSYGSVEILTETHGSETAHIYRTPKGELREVRRRTSPHESPFVVEHYLKTPADFEIMEYVLRDQTVTPDYPALQAIIDGIGGQGIVDLVLPRSPLPRVLIDWMGVTAGIYAIYDAPDKLESLLRTMAKANEPVMEIAAKAPGEVCIFGDNIDNITLSPDLFSRYSVPHYRKYSALLQEHGKKVAAHMDGRLQGLLPLIRETGLDIVDGATPAPMNDYEPHELAAALGPGQIAWCGVPASSFCDSTSLDDILALNDRIVEALGDKAILNVGDQVPPDADIHKVAALGEHIRNL
ncbi:MAG: hypothetical protein JW909_10680 [Planctomycetes bacterium]|nr:hypothetical protein [Planctomycetota bacterium]